MTATETASERKQQHLSFAIGATHYGAPILKVKEILQYEGVTRVPGTPPSVRGVINVRGAVVPVVDLGVKFGQREVAETKRTCVLVVEATIRGEALTLGVMADAVNEVIDLAAEEIEPAPAFGTGVRLDHVTGMGKVPGGFLVLLDLDRVLSASEAELAAAAAAGFAEGAVAETTPAAAPPPAA